MQDDYRVELTTSAKRDLAGLPQPLVVRVSPVLLGLRSDPRPRGCRKLSGSGDEYRIRLGGYRILYRVDDKNRAVIIYRIRHRSSAYK